MKLDNEIDLLNDIELTIDVDETAKALWEAMEANDTLPVDITYEEFRTQVEFEERMRGAGIHRHWKNIEKNKERGTESETNSVRRLMDKAVLEMAKGIEEFLAEANTGKAGRKHKAYKYLTQVKPMQAAFLAVRAILDDISDRSPFQSTALEVGTLIEDEVRFTKFKQEKKAYAGKVIDRVSKQTSNYKYQRTVTVNAMNKMLVEWEDWPMADKVHLGGKLIELMIERTGLVERVMRTNGPKTIYFIQATEKTLKWLATEDARCEALTPLYLPSIIRPKDWTSPYDGGYWSGRVRNLRLVKTNNKAYLEELSNIEMPMVYNAINAMQRTAWAINRPVFDVMAQLWANHSTLASIPPVDELPLPERPLGIPSDVDIKSLSQEDQDRMQTWKREAASIYEKNTKLKGRRMQFRKILWMADILKDFEEFYMVYQMDFRGRVYAVPMFLNPQGSDFARGLLTFASAVPIGDADGEMWLAVHGAGLWGVDKVSLEDRLEWVKEKEKAILASAEDPFHNLFWTEAEKPWQALAFCFEWAGYRREGYSFMSSLPVQMDGTCNGLQNFSAMLRDPVGGAAVNLLPGDKPNDVYAVVMEAGKRQIERDAQHHDDENIRDIAQKWLPFCTRKVAKRPTMTYCYGSREYGFKTQVYDDIIDAWDDVFHGKPFPFTDAQKWKAAEYMGSVLWDCIGTVVVAAAEAMEWLREAAKVAASDGLPVRWTTPAGFVVQQDYRVQECERIGLIFQKVMVRLFLQKDTAELDKRKQQSGISPNWVHSFDAAHMQLTVCAAAWEGIQSFSLIHDSYGTHAGNTQVLAEILREQFVQMYSGNVLAAFREELLAQLPEGTELREVPEQGSLDLSLILNSRFFFS